MINKSHRKTLSQLPALREEEEEQSNFYIPRHGSLAHEKSCLLVSLQSASLSGFPFRSVDPKSKKNEKCSEQSSVSLFPDSTVTSQFYKSSPTTNQKILNNTFKSTNTCFKNSISSSHFSTFSTSPAKHPESSSAITSNIIPHYLRRLQLIEKSPGKAQGIEGEEYYQRRMAEIRLRLEETLKSNAIGSELAKDDLGDFLPEKLYSFRIRSMHAVHFRFKCQDMGSPLMIRLYFDKQSQLNPRFSYSAFWSFKNKQPGFNTNDFESTNKPTIYVQEDRKAQGFSSDYVFLSLFCFEGASVSVCGRFRRHEDILKRNSAAAVATKSTKNSFFDENILRVYEKNSKEQIEKIKHSRRRSFMERCKNQNFIKFNKEKQGKHSPEKTVAKIKSLDVIFQFIS
jgi:hypothetical protein